MSETNIVASPINGVIPPVAHRFKKGKSGRPPGLVAHTREYLDGYGKKTEANLVRIRDDVRKPVNQREAAGHHLLILEAQRAGRTKEACELYRVVCGDPTKHVQHSLIRKLELIERQVFGQEVFDE